MAIRACLTEEAKALGLSLPSQSYIGDAGYNLPCLNYYEDDDYGTIVIGTGLILEIPQGYCGLIIPRSSTNKNESFTVCIGLIDSNYRSEIKVILKNYPTNMLYRLDYTESFAQIIIIPCLSGELIDTPVESMLPSQRGSKWNGSSNK